MYARSEHLEYKDIHMSEVCTRKKSDIASTYVHTYPMKISNNNFDVCNSLKISCLFISLCWGMPGEFTRKLFGFIYAGIHATGRHGANEVVMRISHFKDGSEEQF